MSKFRLLLFLAALPGFAASGWAQSPGAPQGPGRGVAPVQSIPTAAFRATYYEVRASLDAVGQVMNAQAKVHFAAREAGRVVEVELNQNLRVNSVRDVSGRPVSYDRDDSSSLKLHVTLDDTVPAGGKVTLFFDYGGPLSSRMNNPDQGVSMAYIAKDGGYLASSLAVVSADRFSCQSIYRHFSNRSARNYDGRWHRDVHRCTRFGDAQKCPAAPPPPMLGNARSSAAPVSPMSAPPPPSMENERMLYSFRVDRPEAAGTFVIAPLQLSPTRSEGATYSIYTPPAAVATAPAYADAVAHVLDYFNTHLARFPSPG